MTKKILKLIFFIETQFKIMYIHFIVFVADLFMNSAWPTTKKHEFVTKTMSTRQIIIFVDQTEEDSNTFSHLVLFAQEGELLQNCFV